MQSVAQVRFYGNLNDFLGRHQKEQWLAYLFTDAHAVKDAIEALGVPHVEVAAIVINDKPADFLHKLQPDDTVAVFDESVIIPNKMSLRPPLPQAHFIADVHLGKLVRYLRLLGIDTLYETHFTDAQIAQEAAIQNRIVLTRDVDLLKHKIIHWGYWLRSQQPIEQVKAVCNRYGLFKKFAPLTRCMACNSKLLSVQKEAVAGLVPENTFRYYQIFQQCTGCRKIYWQGAHYKKMQALLKEFGYEAPD